MSQQNLTELANLIRKRNSIAKKITEIIGRPAQIGHLGEYIASEIFDIVLEESAANKGFDGRFRSGTLVGKTVNIKWYAKREGVLDIRPDAIPNYYLVLAGPISSATSSRGDERLWIIESVFLFDAQLLISSLESKGHKIGVSTSVARQYWDNAEIFPSTQCGFIKLDNRQLKLLSMFGNKQD